MYKCDYCGKGLDGIIAISKHDCPKRPVTPRQVHSVTVPWDNRNMTVLMGVDAWETFNKLMSNINKKI